MPLHDWAQVPAGTFHDFHTAWITRLKEGLNEGLLPAGYYAMAEQHAGRFIADVLTLEANSPETAARRTLAIRHTSGHGLVALVEILSPGNKDRASSVQEFVDKVHAALQHGCHVLLIDLFLPGPFDPRGMHGAIWESYDPAEYILPNSRPLTLAAYVANALPVAYVEHLALGMDLPDMPLFLQIDKYIYVPLEATYRAAYRGMPPHVRGLLDKRPHSGSS